MNLTDMFANYSIFIVLDGTYAMTALDDALLPSIAYLALATVQPVNTTKSDIVHVCEG